MKFTLLATIMLVLLTGCSAPLSTLKPEFIPLAATPKDKGHVIFSLFDIPKGNGELFIRFMFGMPRGINASVYDVTDGLIYLGSFEADKGGGFIEYDAPLGKRVFMLAFPEFPKPLAIDHTDFIEVDVSKEKTSHVALSQQGLRQMSYFSELELEDRHFEYCTGLTGKYDIREENIEKYMSTERIDINAKYFMGYCRTLSNNFRRILTPNSNGYEMFEQNKIKVQSLKEKYMPEWKQNYVKQQPFNLFQPYKFFQAASSDSNNSL